MLVHRPNWANLAARIKTLKDSRHAPLRGFYVLCRFVWRVASVLGDPNARSVLVVRHFHAEKAHQIASNTAADRYPDLFSRCRRHFETRDEFQTSDGWALMESEVEQLRAAMAGFNPPPLGETELSPDLLSDLEPVIAASWQGPSA